ncbi:hypothetical protein O181_000616 [Austropuccinia psidii MF-1]|uniref:Uncharacterized protein n=1 Tax=Austropuccinia psidii MF-1 TaxID=1389203 RepID=A0A9Q3GBQ8_9BASI|nr:hypothetical protein [Austropuccinia psidii MF-1]
MPPMPPHQPLRSCGTLNPPYAFSHLLITILTLSQCPPNIPPTLLLHRPNPQCHLPSLHSCNALKMRLQCRPHLCPHHSLLFHNPASSSVRLKILTDMPPTWPSTLLIPSPTHLILSANYHPYTLAASSQHASDAAPTLA